VNFSCLRYCCRENLSGLSEVNSVCLLNYRKANEKRKGVYGSGDHLAETIKSDAFACISKTEITSLPVAYFQMTDGRTYAKPQGTNISDTRWVRF